MKFGAPDIGCGDFEYQDTGEGAGATKSSGKLTHYPNLVPLYLFAFPTL
jgi:hypothetical protein